MTTQLSQWKKSRRKFEPRSEQIRGMRLIAAGKGSRLFLHPGKGKTATVLKAFQILKKNNLVDHLLVLAPLRVITTSWPQQLDEWEDFEGITYTTIHGNRYKAMQEQSDVYLMNFEGLLSKQWVNNKATPNPIAVDFLKRGRFMLAVDESTKMKSPSSARFKCLKTLLPFLHYRTIMTGTPKPNKLEDLFAQCYITDQGKDLGQYITHFRSKYMLPSPDGYGYVPQHGADKRIAEKIASTTLQLDYEEAVPSQTIPVWVPMPESVRSFYNTLKKEFLASIDGQTVIAPNSGVLLNKLRQVAQGAIYGDDGEAIELHTAKLDALTNIIAELDGEPAFCLVQYRHDTARIQARMKKDLGLEVPCIASGVSAAKGAEYAQQFSHGMLPLLLGHPQSVAHGIDGLQKNCCNVIWFGLDWSWENFYQANLRVVRHGSKAEQVFIYQILVDCDIERAILASVSNKRTSEAGFLEELRKHLT